MPSLSKPGIVHPIQQTTGVLVQKSRVDYVSFHTRVFVIATQSIVFEGHLGNLRRQGVEQARTHSRRESAAVSSRSSSKGICGEISNIRWFQEKNEQVRVLLHACSFCLAMSDFFTLDRYGKPKELFRGSRAPSLWQCHSS